MLGRPHLVYLINVALANSHRSNWLSPFRAMAFKTLSTLPPHSRTPSPLASRPPDPYPAVCHGHWHPVHPTPTQPRAMAVGTQSSSSHARTSSTRECAWRDRGRAPPLFLEGWGCPAYMRNIMWWDDSPPIVSQTSTTKIRTIPLHLTLSLPNGSEARGLGSSKTN